MHASDRMISQGIGFQEGGSLSSATHHSDIDVSVDAVGIAFFATVTGPPAGFGEGDTDLGSAEIGSQQIVLVTVEDGPGNALGGVDVTYVASDGMTYEVASDACTTTAALSPDPSGDDGVLQLCWTLGTTAGTQTLSFTVGGETIVFTIDAVAGPADQILYSSPADGDFGIADPGETIGPAIAAVQDQYGNAKSGETVDWATADGSFVEYDGTSCTTTPTSTSTTGAGGLASVCWTLPALVGSYTADALAAGLAGSPLTYSAEGQTGSATFLVLDDESISKDKEPNFFSELDVNDGIADIGLRAQLPFFAANVGDTITLPAGQAGDEGWFALKTIPSSWDAAGPTGDGLRNFVGNPVGPGLGSGSDPEALLDNIPDVTPLGAKALRKLQGTVCAVVYKGDVSINLDPLTGSLKGANLGTVAFKVLSVISRGPSLPSVSIEILDADVVCPGGLILLT